MITNEVRAQWQTRWGWPVAFYPTLPSTNEALVAAARQGLRGPQVCLAAEQTAGRGRQARPWTSPTGGNVYLSLLWPLPRPANGLSLAVGLALALALAELGVVVTLKWPNDVIHEQRKLGGILIELVDDQAVIGIGLNVALPTDAAIDQPWVDLQQLLCPLPSYEILVETLLRHLQQVLHRFADGGLVALADEWQRFDGLRGRTVQVHHPREVLHGVVRGIDDEGALLVEISSQLRRFVAGEVRVRW